MDRYTAHNTNVLSLDWMSFTVWIPQNEDKYLVEQLGFTFEEMELQGSSGRGFKERWSPGIEGITFYRVPASLAKEETQDDEFKPYPNVSSYISVELSSTGLHHIGVEKVLNVLRKMVLTGIRVNCSRLDIAFDSFDIDIDRCHKQLKQGDVETRVDPNNIERYGNITGTSDTIYIGSKNSAARMRIYKKYDEKHLFGDEFFTRVELQLRDDRAKGLLQVLLTAPKAIYQNCVDTLLGFIDFGEWWRSILGAKERLWEKIGRKQSSVEKIGDWLYSQVLPSLTTYVAAKSKKPGAKGMNEADIDIHLMLNVMEQLFHDGLNMTKENHQAMFNVYDPFADGVGIYQPIRNVEF